MSVFEPKVIVSILRNSSIVPQGEREKFRMRWSQSVEKWENLPPMKAYNHPLAQLQWEAEVVEYVTLLWNAVRCRSQKVLTMKTLRPDVPILRPHFVPLTCLHSRLRPGPNNIQPDMQYLKPINIIHPLYYPELAKCPQCSMAVGEIPVFYKRCALMRELFNLVVELRPSTTSGGLAEQIKPCCGSIDSTFKSASKATVTDSHCKRSKDMINKKGEIVAWCLCQTKANAEITELLTGIRRRHETLGLPMPKMMVTNNCCQVRRAVESALPEMDCILDVWHFIARYIASTLYVAVILNSGKNVYRAAVAADITNAVLKKHSVNGSGAEYWNKVEQEQKLEAAFSKWAEKGTVWSAAAMQVHKEQLNHIRKGCLECRCQDIASDGSRIEGSHKGWNSLQRVQPSGITVLVALGHDFVLENGVSSDLKSLPELAVVHSGETFGLITSDHMSTFGGLIDIEEELTEDDDAATIQSLEFEYDATADLALQASRPVLEELKIDLQLLDQPASPNVMNTTGAAKRKLESTLSVDRAGGATLTTSLTTTALSSERPPIGDSCIDISPIEAVPPVSKRARLGSLTKPSDSDAQALVHAVSELDTSRPGRLDHYFKTKTTNVLATPESSASHCPTSIIDARALAVNDSDEFFLFMDMRAEFQWVSHEMMRKQWVEATAEYNKRLVSKRGPFPVLKHPLALLRKLGELEPQLMNRIMKGNYMCKYYRVLRPPY
ncbi:hypothetical protein OG21DRAFT_1479620 [Imleria badia]|nr:hypothetical protein OG21DRAFT_1479620 [Imleria badia]